jgi:hypothetical protein
MHLFRQDASYGDQETGAAGEKLDAGGARVPCYNHGDCESGSASGSVHMSNVGQEEVAMASDFRFTPRSDRRWDSLGDVRQH